ncbi:unnamed protein product [Lactuca virosa]|uniref:Uncharacterized protein n=1 Tax=Lactuca virosa TaxID=75947 RepID=A0AAU9ML41_9ASTR|nr:unnamed protein product [Lactuca virosa]
MNVTLSDNAMQKLTGTTSDKNIQENEHNNRKKLPPSITKYKIFSKKMAVQMMKTSTTNNIRFVVTDVERITTSQSVALTTPATQIKVTSNISDVYLTSSSNPLKSKVARTLTFEDSGKT